MASSLHFELLFDAPRAVETERVIAGLRAAGFRCEVGRGRVDPATVVLTFPDETLPEGAGSPQLVLVPVPRLRRQDLLVALGQTWTWMDAHDVVDGCTSGLLVSDRLSHLMPRERRLQWLRAVLRVVFEQHPCRAVHCICSGQMVEPAEMRRSLETGANRLFGLINVRVFGIEGSDGVWLDTLGMKSLGLPDLQCAVRADDDLSAVGQRLFELAYEVEAGQLELSEGCRIAGLGPHHAWDCVTGDARVSPKRPAVHLVEPSEEEQQEAPTGDDKASIAWVPPTV